MGPAFSISNGSREDRSKVSIFHFLGKEDFLARATMTRFVDICFENVE